jgi:L-lactate dehydrogenase complex protein LldE
VKGIEFVDFERPDECCGFGGTFSVTEEAVSAKMGHDKVGFIGKTGAEYIVSSDMSCLMHLEGCARRLHKNLKFLHMAQILNGGPL